MFERGLKIALSIVHPFSFQHCLGTQVKFHPPSESLRVKACPCGKVCVFTLLFGLKDMLNAKSALLRVECGMEDSTVSSPGGSGELWL